MRGLVVCLVGVVGAAANASFEMMLIGEVTASGSRVMRYDPESRINLGSFGLGRIPGDVRDVAVDKASNECFVLSTTGAVTRFNYNTGEYLGAILAGSFYTSINYSSSRNGILIGGNGSANVSPARFQDRNGVATGFSAGGFATSAPYEAGTVTVLGASNSGFAPYVAAGASPTFALTTAFTSTLPTGYTNSYFEFVHSGSRLLAAYTTPTGFVAATRFNMAGTTLTSIGDFGFNFGAPAARFSMAMGHGNLMYALNGETISAVDLTINTLMGSWTVSGPAAGTLRGMAIVIAPEPSSMLALSGLVLGVVARRRRE
jgi:hypothetical protein